MIRAYVMRHGSTAISPAPEGWKPVPLSRVGCDQVVHAADFMEQYLRRHPSPTYGVASDLPRAEETLAVMAQFIPMEIEKPMRSLRAYERTAETPLDYERRTLEALNALLCAPGLPFIVCHRSTTGFLAKHHKMWERDPDYSQDALLLEGGILAITDSGIIPVYHAIEANWRTSAQTSPSSDRDKTSSKARTAS